MSGGDQELQNRQQQEVLQVHETAVLQTQQREQQTGMDVMAAQKSMLLDLADQFSTLGQIRRTGVPEHLQPAQKESGRYEHVGHFDKKARKGAAKEAQSLTRQAKALSLKMSKRPAGALTVPYNVQMTELMKQAELETLKANGYKKDSPEYHRTHLKYLRHHQLILEKSLREEDLSDGQYAAVSKTLLQVGEKIQAVQALPGVREVETDGYMAEAAREADKEELSPQEGEKELKRMLRVARETPVDLLGLRVFSPKLLRVNEQQAASLLQEEKGRKKQEGVEKKQREKEKRKQAWKPGDPEIMKMGWEDFTPVENEETQLIDDLMEELEKYRDQLGGAPNEGQDAADEKNKDRVVLGMPWDTFKKWVDKYTRKPEKKGGNKLPGGGIEQIRAEGHNKLVRGVVKLIGRLSGYKQGKPLTDYELAHDQLTRMRKLASCKDQLDPLLIEAGKSQTKQVEKVCDEIFTDLTGLMFHSDMNGLAGEASFIKDHFELLRSARELAEQKGKKKEFFAALQGVCFEDRCKVLQRFYMSLSEKELRPNMPEEGIHVRYVDDMPDVQEGISIADAASDWIAKLDLSEGSGEFGFSFEEVLPCLRHELLGKKFMLVSEASGFGPVGDEPVEVTEELLNSEVLKRALVNNCSIFDRDIYVDLFGEDMLEMLMESGDELDG